MSTKNPLPLPLPKVCGPKLEPFRGTANANIEFIKFIGSDKDLDSKVWKVRIDDRFYALKIFAFQNWEFLAATEGAVIMPPALTPEEYIDYLDPFNCECRVYGRLKQEGHEDLAVRAHGYVLLTREQERDVTEALGEGYVDWEKHPVRLNCDGVFSRWEVHRHQRLRAIVKDYVESAYPWTASQIPRMYADLEKLHELGILVRDIHPGNYLGGKLVDFSQAWTMYHPCLERSTPAAIHDMRLEEPSKFEEMVDIWACSENKKIQKPAALVKWRSKRDEDIGFDPRKYKWEKWLKRQK